jgi:hypothetical protein
VDCAVEISTKTPVYALLAGKLEVELLILLGSSTMHLKVSIMERSVVCVRVCVCVRVGVCV